jgi:hypothetical protein
MPRVPYGSFQMEFPAASRRIPGDRHSIGNGKRASVRRTIAMAGHPLVVCRHAPAKRGRGDDKSTLVEAWRADPRSRFPRSGLMDNRGRSLKIAPPQGPTEGEVPVYPDV